MSPDHLNEEGLAELEDIEIPFSIIHLLSILLTISYGIHVNGHFWIASQDNLGCAILLVFSFALYDIKQKERSLDSTQGRDQPIDLEAYQQILPESPTPTTEIIRDIRPQIHFQQNSHIDEIPNTSTFIGNISYISQKIINLPVYANIPHIHDLPKVQQDKQLEEFLRGEIRCQNFINQDLAFVQPSLIHTLQPKEDSILP